MNIAARLLPQEHEARWRQFWERIAPKLESSRLVVDVQSMRARVMRKINDDLNVLVDSFSIDDSPESIESRLAELVGGAA